MAVSWKKIVVLVVLAAAIFGVLPQIHGFGDSIQIMRQAQLGWVGAAVLVAGSSYIVAALVYMSLAKHTLRLGTTSLVQLASTFTNRLLPAGIGAIAVNYDYLRRCKHTSGQAAAIVLLNNTFGFIGNMLLLAGFIVFASVKPPALHLPGWTLFAAVGIMIVVVIVIERYSRKLRRSLAAFVKALAAYGREPGRLVVALLASIALTVCYTLCLLACAKAVSLDIGLPALFVAMSFGVAGATVTPTPGGLGGAEAALVAALLIYGAARPQALAAVLLYRLCTFWLPLVVGSLAFGYARKQKYI